MLFISYSVASLSPKRTFSLLRLSVPVEAKQEVSKPEPVNEEQVEPEGIDHRT